MGKGASHAPHSNDHWEEFPRQVLYVIDSWVVVC